MPLKVKEYNLKTVTKTFILCSKAVREEVQIKIYLKNLFTIFVYFQVFFFSSLWKFSGVSSLLLARLIRSTVSRCLPPLSRLLHTLACIHIHSPLKCSPGRWALLGPRESLRTGKEHMFGYTRHAPRHTRRI